MDIAEAVIDHVVCHITPQITEIGLHLFRYGNRIGDISRFVVSDVYTDPNHGAIRRIQEIHDARTFAVRVSVTDRVSIREDNDEIFYDLNDPEMLDKVTNDMYARLERAKAILIT